MFPHTNSVTSLVNPKQNCHQNTQVRSQHTDKTYITILFKRPTMLSRIIAFTLLVSLPAMAADDCTPTPVDAGVLRDLTSVSSRLNVECPHQLDVGSLCNAVSDQLQEQNSSAGTRYRYQTMIYQASCIESGDSVDVIKAKIQNFWNKYHDQLACNSLSFSIKNGNILKLAIEMNSRNFINDSVRRWGVNLNHIDSTDHQTVLDYIEAQLRATRGTPREQALQSYFDIFRKNGAKLSREL